MLQLGRGGSVLAGWTVVIALTSVACSDGDDAGGEPVVPEADASAVDDGGAEAANDSGNEAMPPSDASTQDAGWAGRHTFSGAQGARDYLVHVPASLTEPSPLVVVLHGCTQDADAMRIATRFDELANEEGFVVVFPEQDPAANVQRCWNWFLGANQTRDGGETGILAGIVQEVREHVAIDPARIHVTGLSAGGAMAVVLASTWPDVFSTVAVASGCPFKGIPCVQGPSQESADVLAGYVVSAMGDRARLMPMIAMQGDQDTMVTPDNFPLLVAQWLGAADRIDDGEANGSISATAASEESATSAGGLAYEVARYAGPGGTTFLEAWLIQGMGHAWSGGAAVSWSEPDGPDATRAMWEFMKARTK